MNLGTTLVTGASAGIGEAFAREFARNGHDVVLVARREDRLSELADELSATHGVDAHPVTQDLAARDGPDDLYESVRDRDIQVDVLVNNVGIGSHGKVTDVPLERDLDQLQLNVAVPTHLTKLFGADMVERGRGGVLNVASSAAFQPGPFMAVYYASKSYVLSFSEAVAEELRDDGVRVTAICPGPVETEFQERAGMEHTPLGRGEMGLLGGMQSAESVAEAGYEGLADGKAVVVPGRRYWLLEKLARVTPRSLSRRLAKQVNVRQ